MDRMADPCTVCDYKRFCDNAYTTRWLALICMMIIPLVLTVLTVFARWVVFVAIAHYLYWGVSMVKLNLKSQKKGTFIIDE